MTNRPHESSHGHPDSPEGGLWRLEQIRLLNTLHGQAHDLDRDADLDARKRQLRTRKLYVKKASLEIPNVKAETVLMTPRGIRPVPLMAPPGGQIPMLFSQRRPQESDTSVLLYFPIDEKEAAVWMKITDENENETKIMLTELRATYFDHDEPAIVDSESSLFGPQHRDDYDFSDEYPSLVKNYSEVDTEYVDRVFQAVMQFTVTAQENHFPVL
jgi:hypothetical protein